MFCFGTLLYGACTNHATDEAIKIVAHRGGMADRPENTMAAFQRSVELGADILELDLRASIDGQLFILHDETLDRTTGETGIATDLMLKELQELDAGSWFGREYAGERIPSFREVLQWAAEEDVMLLLDLKETGREYAERVAGNVRDVGMQKNVVVGVRSLEQSGEFHSLLPDTRQLAFMGTSDQIEEYADAGVEVLRLWLHWLEEDPFLADRVHETGKKLMINGTDGHPEEVKRIMNFKPDWILIDDPLQLIKSLHELE